MLRRSINLFEMGTILNWRQGARFGFIGVDGDASKSVFVHQSAIVQARNQRPLTSLKRGVQVQFDTSTDDQGRVTAKNVTAADGRTLSNRDEVPSTTVDIRALRSRLTTDDDDSHHGRALKGIVQSVATIAAAQRKTSNMNRNIIRLLNSLADKEGVKEILTGEAYTEAKQSVMANAIKEAEERKAKRDERKGKGEDDAEDDEEADEEEVEVKKSSKKAEATAEKKDSKKATKAAAVEEFHSADDLLDLMDETEGKDDKKAAKGKKSKKN